MRKPRHGRFSLLAVVAGLTLVQCLLLLPAAGQQPLEGDDQGGASLMHVPSHDDQETQASPKRSVVAPAVAAAAKEEGDGSREQHDRHLTDNHLGDGIFTLLMSSNANYLRINMPKDGLL